MVIRQIKAVVKAAATAAMDDDDNDPFSNLRDNIVYMTIKMKMMMIILQRFSSPANKIKLK